MVISTLQFKAPYKLTSRFCTIAKQTQDYNKQFENKLIHLEYCNYFTDMVKQAWIMIVPLKTNGLVWNTLFYSYDTL